MIFGVFFALTMIVLLIRLFIYFIGFGYVAAVVVDILVFGGFIVYYGHHEWFVHIASGKAVYFWDAVLFVLFFFLYGAIVLIGTSKFPRIARVFHYVIAWMATGFIYVAIHLTMFNGLGMLVNNPDINKVIHLMIVSLLAIFIFKTRMRIFTQKLT